MAKSRKQVKQPQVTTSETTNEEVKTEVESQEEVVEATDATETVSDGNSSVTQQDGDDDESSKETTEEHEVSFNAEFEVGSEAGLEETPKEPETIPPLEQRKTLTSADLLNVRQSKIKLPEWVEDYSAIKANPELAHILDLYIREVGRENQIDDRTAINTCQVRLFRQLYMVFTIADGAKLKATLKDILALWKANPGEAFSDARYMLYGDSIILSQAELNLWRNLGQVYGLASRQGRVTVAKHLDIDLIANQIEGIARNQAVGERFREYFSN